MLPRSHGISSSRKLLVLNAPYHPCVCINFTVSPFIHKLVSATGLFLFYCQVLADNTLYGVLFTNGSFTSILIAGGDDCWCLYDLQQSHLQTNHFQGYSYGTNFQSVLTLDPPIFKDPMFSVLPEFRIFGHQTCTYWYYFKNVLFLRLEQEGGAKSVELNKCKSQTQVVQALFHLS